MVEPKVTVYGAYWCPDCRRSKKFLGEQFIPYRWIDIEQDLRGSVRSGKEQWQAHHPDDRF
jgi:thioredoxin reductase (NADPH)